jgi:lipopolysaccharide export system ATP-binding protein
MSKIVLRAEGLSKSFGSLIAVDNVSFSVYAASVVGVLGPNGAGKSTLFQMLAGLMAPDNGQVFLAGDEVTQLPLHRRAQKGMGYLPQGPSSLPRLSARQNIIVAIEAAKAQSDTVNSILARAGLVECADQLVSELSGGQRRRLEIARCLATSPRVVLMDEPFAGVAPVNVETIQTQIRQLAESGVAVVITDHAVAETLPICDSVLILDSGRELISGAPSVVAADPLTRSRYLGNSFSFRAVEALQKGSE